MELEAKNREFLVLDGHDFLVVGRDGRAVKGWRQLLHHNGMIAHDGNATVYTIKYGRWFFEGNPALLAMHDSLG